MAKRKKTKKVATWAQAGSDKIELIVATVECPFDRGTYREVALNIRESGLGTMRARGLIDQAQFRAGDWYRSRWERMGANAGGAVDPSNEPVDVSGAKDPISIKALMAGQELAEIRAALPKVTWPVVEMVCARGFGVTQVARLVFGSKTPYSVRRTGKSLRFGLNEMAFYLGFATKNS